MNLLPKASGHRPRLACEMFGGGVIAARSPEPGAPLSAVARAELAEGAIVPSLKPGNIADRIAVIAALRRTLEQAGARANARNADLTLVIPDAAARVLLLDFDSLPNKLSEALPIVRFRLKKLLPFDADHAMVSFQVMSTSRTVVRVLAVAMPRDVLTEYESVAREAGFEPGAVLPSTLAALAGLNEEEGAALLVNAHPSGVTTAIVRSGILLLHRSVEMAEQIAATPANLPPALFERSPAMAAGELLPLVDREDTAGEWAAQEALPGHSRDSYDDGLVTATAAPAPSIFPYAVPMVLAELDAQLHNPVLFPPTSLGTFSDVGNAGDSQHLGGRQLEVAPEPPVHTLVADVQDEEIARAVSVAVAYFEDMLGVPPATLLSAGPMGADRLNRTLREQGVAEADGLRIREMVEGEAIAASAVSGAVPRGWLSGVVGALKS